MKKILERACYKIYCLVANKHKIDFWGYCPVQSCGQLKTGEYYYFRSRGSQWSLELSRKSMDEQEISANNDFFDNVFWEYRAKNVKPWPTMGYITKLEALKLFNFAVKKYYKEKR